MPEPTIVAMGGRGIAHGGARGAVSRALTVMECSTLTNLSRLSAHQLPQPPLMLISTHDAIARTGA